MARVIGKLSAASLAGLASGLHSDGGGLYLHVNRDGARSWIFRYMLHRRAREMGLGPLHAVGLADARRRATAARAQLVDEVDPIAARQASRQAAQLAAAKTITFRKAAEEYIRAHGAGWRNRKHGAQWAATLERYAYPAMGALPVGAIDVGLVLKAIEPIWTTTPETANRVRGRIERILDWAKARGYRDGDNPARLRGHLDQLLMAPEKAKQAKRQKTGRAEHHAALPYQAVAGFLAELRQQPGMAARALEFAILTAARTGEVLGARWSEISLVDRLWTIPAERMKAGREHRVPLSDAAISLLNQISADHTAAGHVFPGAAAGRPFQHGVMLEVLRRMGRGEFTAHGFRSTFATWCKDRGVAPELREMALAHVEGDKVAAAYTSGAEVLDLRRALAERWAAFCALPPASGGGEIVPIRRVG